MLIAEAASEKMRISRLSEVRFLRTPAQGKYSVNWQQWVEPVKT